MSREIIVLLGYLTFSLTGFSQEKEKSDVPMRIIIDVLHDFELVPTASDWKIEYLSKKPLFRFVRCPYTSRDYAIKKTVILPEEKSKALLEALGESIVESGPSGWIGNHPEFVITVENMKTHQESPVRIIIYLVSFKNSSIIANGINGENIA